MRRQILITLIVLGTLLTGLSGVGLFAALTDTATSDGNNADTGALPSSADLKIANAVAGSGVECGPYLETGAGPLASFTAQNPGDGPTSYVCLRNQGSAPVTLSVKAGALSDFEVACTGDEAIHDTTCTGMAGEPGELASSVDVSVVRIECLTLAQDPGAGASRLDLLASNPMTLHQLNPGSTSCYRVTTTYQPPSPAARQASQSDRVEWQFVFTAQA